MRRWIFRFETAKANSKSLGLTAESTESTESTEGTENHQHYHSKGNLHQSSVSSVLSAVKKAFPVYKEVSLISHSCLFVSIGG